MNMNIRFAGDVCQARLLKYARAAMFSTVCAKMKAASPKSADKDKKFLDANHMATPAESDKLAQDFGNDDAPSAADNIITAISPAQEILPPSGPSKA